MKKALRLSCLLTTLLLACGRTGVGKSNHPDAGQGEGRDEAQDYPQEAFRAADSATGIDSLGSIDGKRTCGTFRAGYGEWPVVELVVDRSTALQAPAVGSQSGWEITRAALKRVISRLTPTSPAIGLTLFPNSGDCTVAPITVPATPITDQTKADLIAALDGVLPGGARSPATALALAQDDADTRVFPNGLRLSPFKTLILLTAGAPEPSPVCGVQDDAIAALKNQVRSAYGNNARTCVFDLPGTGSARDVLVEVAELGSGSSGVLDASSPPTCFRDCDQGLESGPLLETGIECILDQGTLSGDECIPNYGDYGSCVLSLPDLPADADRNNVTVVMTTGASPTRAVPHVDCSSSGADGWDYSSNGRAVIFCGQACEDALAAWYESVTFGCKGD